MRFSFEDTILEELQNLKSSGLYRFTKTIDSSPGSYIYIDDKRYINFSSNNYLGLALHPALKEAVKKALDFYGVGATSSRLVAGTLSIHKELEYNLSMFKHKESALVYPSGFQTNLGVIATLARDGDCLIFDQLNHASIWDSAKLSKARLFVYKHNDMNSLEKVLIRSKSYKKRFIVTDSVFSMDGDIVNLLDIVNLSERYDACIIIDDAHATGIFGEDGSGIAQYFKVEDKVHIVIGTLSKALGSQGGFVACSNVVIEYLKNKSRPFIYTTALSPILAAAANAAINIIEQEPDRRIKLLNNAKFLRDEIKKRGFSTLNSSSQIIPILIGDVEKTIALSKRLFEKGIYAPAIRPPTVPEGTSRIRISLTSEHTQEDLEYFLDVLGYNV